MISSLIYLSIVAIVAIATLIGRFWPFAKVKTRAVFQTGAVWLSLGLVVLVWVSNCVSMPTKGFMSFYADRLSWVMATLILFVSAIIHHFSIYYMSGDALYSKFFLLLGAVTVFSLGFVAQDHLLLYPLFLGLSNYCLVQLMIHKSGWKPAYSAGLTAAKYLGAAILSLFISSFIIGQSSGIWFLHELSSYKSDSIVSLLISSCIVVGALLQSANMPFHGWVASSLNSPTPVSALMHAGLVNAGGYLLVRFSGILQEHAYLMAALFVVGFITSLLGIFWKLVQSDVKRMLAYSTIAQMGFMSMQCALGLFAPAIAHICLHGLFKAYLFLQSGSTVSQTRLYPDLTNRTIPALFVALCLGAVSATFFGYIAHFSWYTTEVFLIGFCFLAMSQLALVFLEKRLGLLELVLALLVSLTFAGIYGLSISCIEKTLSFSFLSVTPTWYHWAVFAVVAAMWTYMNLPAFLRLQHSQLYKRLYVWALVKSQPAKECVTSTRQIYQY